MHNKSFYCGQSMRRVFVPGDLLEWKEVPFSEFRKGDIVAFQQPLSDAKAIVHRVVDRTDEFLVTMGDNNPFPDEHHVVEEDNPRLIISRSPKAGVVLRVSNGRMGMCSFYWHRVRRFVRHVAGVIVRRIFRLNRRK